jgi:hypothetical protein
MRRPSAAEVIDLLGLEPLAGEGGFYRRTWASPSFAADGSHREAGSAIYFLVTAEPEGFSALHRLKTDELYHFYAGDAVELHLIDAAGRHETHILGADLADGQRPQRLAPAGLWQGSRLAPDGEWALLGTTMAPAFTAGEFELASRAALLSLYPALADIIARLTRE